MVAPICHPIKVVLRYSGTIPFLVEGEDLQGQRGGQGVIGQELVSGGENLFRLGV